MNNQNKAKTRDELMNELAEEWRDWYVRPVFVNGYHEAFKYGFQAADQNPPPEVQGLIEALGRIRTLTLSWVIAEKTKDCSHTYNEIKYQVDNALETYRKVTSKE